MGTVKTAYIFCDQCRDTFGYNCQIETVQEARDIAAEKDWLYSGGKDLCPKCRPVTVDGYYPGTNKKAVQETQTVVHTPGINRLGCK